jgi:hypothetical protein
VVSMAKTVDTTVIVHFVLNNPPEPPKEK